MQDDCKIKRWSMLKGQLNNLPPTAFADAIKKQPEAILLDCRTPGEFAGGHLPGAINFNYLSQDFVGEMKKFDPLATYLIYCRSERRSLRTCMLFKNGGFEKVFNLDGGLNRWFEVFDGLDVQ